MEKLNYYSNYYPNIYFSRDISETLDQKEKYIKNRAFDNQYYKDMILKYVKAFDKVKRSDIDKLLLDKLSDTLNEEQKKRKIKYFLKTLKDDQKIETMREGKNS